MCACRHRYTHWKQTVFYLQEPITICQGEVLEGTLECIPNAKNKRDLDITLSYSFKGQHGSCQVSQQYRMR